MQKYLLYLFDKTEKLAAIFKPDTDRTNAPGMITEYVMVQPFQISENIPREQVSGCQYFGAIHTEQINGQNIFEFSVPADHSNAQYVTEGNQVAFKDMDNYWQFFEVKRVLDVHGAEGLIRTAYCEHVFYELLDDVVEDKRPYDASAFTALTSALEGTRWSVGVVDDLGIQSTNFYYISALEAVRNVADVWGGEIRVRLDVTGGVIAHRYIDILARRGSDTGKIFEYSKDTLNIQRETDTSEICTALYGRGKGVEIEETNGYGRRLTFADVVWTIAGGNQADKPAGQEWIGDPAALTQWGRLGRHRMGIFEDEEETDQAVLLQKTWDRLQELKTPRLSYQLDVMELERLTGYSHEMVRLGDGNRIIDRKFSPQLLVSARIVELKRDLVRPENTKTIHGNFIPVLADGISDLQKISQKVRDKAGVWDRGNQFNVDGTLNTGWLQGTIDVLANGLNSATSNWYTDANGNIIFESADGLKAMKLSGEGFAIANQKNAEGAWIWRTFGTGAGFTADEINAGQLLTSLISIVSEGGRLQITNDTLYIYDDTNTLKVILGNYDTGKYGLQVFGGEVIGAKMQTNEVQLGTLGFFATMGSGERYGAGSTVEGKIQWADGTQNVNYRLTTSANGGTLYLFENGASVGYIMPYFIDADAYMTIRSYRYNDQGVVDGNSKGVYLNAGVNGAGLRMPAASDDVISEGNFSVSYGHSKNATELSTNYGVLYMHSNEAPDAKYFDEGTAELINGEYILTLDPKFLDCIEPHSVSPWVCTATPYGSPLTVYVAEIGANYVKFREKDNNSGVFFWRVSAMRKNFQDCRFVQPTMTGDPETLLTSNWEEEL